MIQNSYKSSIHGMLTALLGLALISGYAECQMMKSKTDKKRTKEERQQLYQGKNLKAFTMDETEPNDSITSANPVPVGEYVSAAIDPAGDIDYFRVNVSDSQTVAFDIDADIIGSWMDSYIELYDSAGQLLAENDDDPSSLDSKLIYTFAVHGNYYLKVTELDDNGGEDYYYLLKIYNIETSGISNMNVLTSWPVSNPCIGVKKSGRYLYSTEVSMTGSCFRVWDISDIFAPALMDSVHTADFISNFELKGDYAYLATSGTGSGLKILNIADAADIKEDTLIVGSEVTNLFISDDTLYAAADGGLRVYSLAIPDAPSFLWQFSITDEYATSVIADSRYVYLSATDYQLHIISKATHNEVGNFDWFDASFMDLKANELYMSAKEGAFMILDVSDPANPAELYATYSEYPGFSVSVKDPYAYFANGNGGLSVYNVSDPENPAVAAYCYSFSDLFAFYATVNLDTVYLASGCVAGWDCNASANRIYILKNSLVDVRDGAPVKTQKPHVISLLNNYPNPFNPSTTIRYELKTGGHVTMKIFNTLGQEVRSLFNGIQQAGSGEIRWDGTDNKGNQVSSGVYVYRIQAGDAVKSKKMILLK